MLGDCKEPLKGSFSRCFLGVQYVLLEFLQKNMGDPYYEPTIVTHDMYSLMQRIMYCTCKRIERTACVFRECVFTSVVILVERVHQIAVENAHGAVIACDVVGPYGVLLLQEGVGLLKLHEEQGEQLLEAGMSVKDEESFMGDDSTKRSILTLEWPKLEQVLSRTSHHILGYAHSGL